MKNINVVNETKSHSQGARPAGLVCGIKSAVSATLEIQGGDPRLQPSGMTSYERPLEMTKRSGHGFTLIELLVVVLIIGILAAVALPQYQKAVVKSRAAELQTLFDSVIKGAHVYYLTHGKDPEHFNQLDLDINLPTLPGKEAVCGINSIGPLDVKKGKDFEIVLYNVGTKYRIGAWFTTGRYKCTGFIHWLHGDGKDGQTFCAEGYYYRSCGTNCDNGDFCQKVMGRTADSYIATIFNYK